MFWATVNLFAQAPEKFSYQSVIRNSGGALITNQMIGMRIRILQGSESGDPVYEETHTPTSNANGLISIEIGAGTVLSGEIATIDWADGPYFIQTETDPTGGVHYSISSTHQLLSVPYALYAKTAGNLSGGGVVETDPVFSESVAKGITGADTANWNQKQEKLIAGSGIVINGNVISATGGGGTGGFVHYIGEHFGGGVVYHVWKDQDGTEHGLIVDTKHLSQDKEWSNVTNLEVGAGAKSSWDGLANSNAIIAQPGHVGSAASMCLNSTNGGFSDWYLPAIDQLALLWQNRFNVNKTLSSIAGAEQLTNVFGYWSSTEYNGVNAYFANLYNLYSGSNLKTGKYYLRAIRSY